jgi:hypothetical protein
MSQSTNLHRRVKQSLTSNARGPGVHYKYVRREQHCLCLPCQGTVCAATKVTCVLAAAACQAAALQKEDMVTMYAQTC